MQARLTFSGEPVAKGRPRAFVRAGRVSTYTPDKTRAAEEAIAASAREQWVGAPWSCPVRLRVDAYFPIRASWSKRKREGALGQPHIIKPDADNLLKLVEDALNGIAFTDDQLVFDTRCVKWWAPTGRVDVLLTAFGHNGGPPL